jgi:hypothetical protein
MSNDPTAPTVQEAVEPEAVEAEVQYDPETGEPIAEPPAEPEGPTEVDQLREALTAQNQTVQQLQATMAQLLGATANAVREGGEGVDEDDAPALEEMQRALWEDPTTFLRQYGVEPAVQEVRKQLEPLLRLQAKDRRAELTNEIRDQFDSQYGDGAFDSEVAGDFNKALDRVPTALQSSRDHIMAAAAGVLGHYYLTGEKGQTLEKKRAARREAPRMLDMTRPQPPRGNQLTPEEKAFVSGVQRTDPSYSEAKYMKAKAAIAQRGTPR